MSRLKGVFVRNLPWLGTCLIPLSLLACGEKEPEERAGGIEIGGTMGPAATPQGQGGDEGDPGENGVAEGSVVQFVSDAFALTAPYSGRAALSILEPDGGGRVDVTYDGVDFVVEGDVLGERWLYVDPDDNSVYPTITWQVLGSEKAEVPVVPRATLERIFQNLTTPAELNTGRAQLLIRIEDEAGNGVDGVKADAFGASVPIIAYKEDAVWPAYLDATTDDGLAFVPNLEAQLFPGQVAQVVLTGSIDDEVEVRLALGAITVITVVVP